MPKQSTTHEVRFLGDRNAKAKSKRKMKTKRNDPKEKIRDSGLSFFRGQPRPANLEL